MAMSNVWTNSNRVKCRKCNVASEITHLQLVFLVWTHYIIPIDWLSQCCNFGSLKQCLQNLMYKPFSLDLHWLKSILSNCISSDICSKFLPRKSASLHFLAICCSILDGFDPTNNVLLVKIDGPVWYTIYHHLPVVKGVNTPLYESTSQ